jgi:ABC-2 type transport system permease protein
VVVQPTIRGLGVRNILTIANNDIRLFLVDRGNLVGLLIVPVVMTLVVGTFAGIGGEGTSHILLDVLDHDRSELSRQLINSLGDVYDELVLCPMGNDDDNLCQIGDDLDREVSVSRMEDSIVQGVFEIPIGFEDRAQASEATSVKLFTMDDFGAPGLLQQAINSAIQRINGAVIASQIGIEAIEPLGLLTEENRTSFTIGLHDKATEFWATNPVSVNYELSGGGIPDGGLTSQQSLGQSVPGMGSMFVMLTVLGGMTVLVVERKQGTLQRLAVMPVTRAQLLGGKILARFVLGILQYLVVFAIGVIAAIDFGRDPIAVVALMVSFTLATTALSFAIGGRVENEMQASGLSLLLSLILAPLGGAWWPLEVVPEFMQTIGHLSPIAWAMDGYNALIFEQARLNDVLIPIGVLLAIALACFYLGVRWFKVE